MHRLLLLGLIWLSLASASFAQNDNWMGKRILVKKPGLKIGYSDDKGKQVFVADLTSMAYTVIGDRDGFIKVHQRGAEAWFDKANALLVDDAIVYFTGKIAADPKESLYYGYRGWAFKEKGSTDNALQDYDKALELKPSADWYNNRGLIRVDRKQFDQAVQDFTQAMRLQPKMVAAFENRGQVYFAHKNWDPALKDFTEALKINPNNPSALYKRAQIWIGKKDLAKALEDVSAGLKMEPKNHNAYVVRGNIQFDRREYDQALADYNQALKIESKIAEAYFQRSQVYTIKKDYIKALVDLEEGLKLQPDNATALAHHGWNLFLTNKFEEAAENFEKALKVNPKEPLALNNWAWMLATSPEEKHRDGKKALEMAKLACEIAKNKDSGFLDTLAAAHAELGEFEDAARVQTQALADPALDKETIEEFKSRLELYKKEKPYRQP